MKKLLLIVLLIVGWVFADTIKYKGIDFDGNDDTKSITGEYAGIYNNKVFVRTEKSGIFEIDCEDVIIIIKDDLSSVEWSCSEETYTPKTLTEADIKKLQKQPALGGILIAFGGGILISQNEKDYEDIDSLEEFKTYNTIAYALITIGGILVAIGI